MDHELIERLLWIGIIGLVLAGALFIGLFLFSNFKDNELLYAALFCYVLAGLFNSIRGFMKK